MLRKNWISLLSILLVTVGVSFLTRTAKAQEPWFGNNPQYKCRCENDNCGTDGNCTNGDGCQQGWFGPACQYRDLPYNFTYHDHSGQNIEGDSRFSNCIDLISEAWQVKVTRYHPFVFTWLRIDVKSSETLVEKPQAQLEYESNKLPCSNQHVIYVDDTTIDIHCGGYVVADTVVLSGSKPMSICDVHISGGRNVAIQQSTSQTSTYSFPPKLPESMFKSDNAVDGNTSTVVRQGSCMHTDAGDWYPQWTVTFHQREVVTEILVLNIANVKERYRLEGFVLNGTNQDGQIVFQYQGNGQPDIYRIIVNSTYVEHIMKNVSIGLMGKEYLTVCEVEIFGDSDCPSGYFGLTCTRICNCENTQETCYVSTGSCPSGCPKGFYGEGCQLECVPERYGKDCVERCSPNCKDGTCERFDGQCTGGCGTAGYQLPHCTEGCATGKYGMNCTQECSSNCREGRCNAITGVCFGCTVGRIGEMCDEVCDPHYYGDDCKFNCSDACSDRLCHHVDGKCNECPDGKTGDCCTEDCPVKLYGPKCSIPCSQHCGEQGFCHNVNGFCSNGCQDGYIGDFCYEKCSNGTYGFNCAMNCSENCVERIDTSSTICRHTNGFCLHGCQENFIGDLCQSREHVGTQTDESDVNVIAIVLPVIVIVLLAVAIAAFIVWRRRRHHAKDTGHKMETRMKVVTKEQDKGLQNPRISQNEIDVKDSPYYGDADVHAASTVESKNVSGSVDGYLTPIEANQDQTSGAMPTGSMAGTYEATDMDHSKDPDNNRLYEAIDDETITALKASRE